MEALLQLTLANIRSFTRDRAALFWTLAFPLIFILMFGAIFSGGGIRGLAQAPGAPTRVVVYTDPTQTNAAADTMQVVSGVLDGVSLAISGRGPAVVPAPRALQTQDLNFVSYLVPSILGMALMQLGVFSAIPLVADREKLILKRLNATPLRRWQLVGSNVIMRLLIGIVQTLIIVGVGASLFGVEIAGNLLLVAALVVLGTLAFIALGYVIASFAATEDAANGMTSVVQFPLMFLSGTFFPIDAMPEFLRAIARLLPLTYLSDALRQTMVGGAAFAPLWVCVAVLAGFLALCFAISARFFRWQ
jgi:ABC-2 type transport system permease protein